jgi:hypothetical protein
MPESVPAYPFADAHLNRSRPDVMAHEGCPQNGNFPWRTGLAKTQSVDLRKRAVRRQARRVRTKRGSSGTGFWDASVLHGPTACLTIDRSTLTCPRSWSRSFRTIAGGDSMMQLAEREATTLTTHERSYVTASRDLYGNRAAAVQAY